MYRILPLFLLLFSLTVKSQVIGKTTVNEMLSELKMSTDVEKQDILYKDGAQIIKVLYKNEHRREFMFYNNVMFCKRIWDPNETARVKFQKMKDEQIVEYDGKSWVLKGVELTVVAVGTDDFGREWLVYVGVPKLN